MRASKIKKVVSWIIAIPALLLAFGDYSSVSGWALVTPLVAWAVLAGVLVWNKVIEF